MKVLKSWQCIRIYTAWLTNDITGNSFSGIINRNIISIQCHTFLRTLFLRNSLTFVLFNNAIVLLDLFSTHNYTNNRYTFTCHVMKWLYLSSKDMFLFPLRQITTSVICFKPAIHNCWTYWCHVDSSKIKWLGKKHFTGGINWRHVSTVSFQKIKQTRTTYTCRIYPLTF